MVFCPLANGQCKGQVNCQLWVRGRLLKTDSKILAAELLRFIIHQNNSSKTTGTTTNELSARYWKNKGISNIHREIIIDRYLKEKVKEVETLVAQRLDSSGFHKCLLNEVQAEFKESPALQTQHCKSPP